jgi:hypothetical protein
MRLKILYLTAPMVLFAIAAFAQSSETLTGVVSDAMCGAEHMMKDASPAKCTRECVKQGSDYALVSGGKVYTLQGKKDQLDKFAGQSVKVTGKLSGTTLTVDSIDAAKP